MEKKIGEITHYFSHIPAGIIKLTDTLKIGDKVHFKGATTDLEQEITSMQVDHKDIEEAKAGDEVGVKVTDRVREEDEVFLVH
jgi:translation elongation factor EF-1alpha